MNDTTQLMCQPMRPLGQMAKFLFTVLSGKYFQILSKHTTNILSLKHNPND